MQNVDTGLSDFEALTLWHSTSNLFSQAVSIMLMDFQPQIPKFVVFCDSSAQKFWFYYPGQQISKLGRERNSLLGHLCFPLCNFRPCE